MGPGLWGMLLEAPERMMKGLHARLLRHCPRVPSPSLQAVPTQASEKTSHPPALHLQDLKS